MNAPAELQIRGFSKADEPFVVLLGRQAFSEYSRDAGASTLWMVEHYSSLIATVDEKPVGLAVVHLPGRAGVPELMALAVERGQRGRGVGKRLLGAAERLAQSRAARRLRLHTADANLAALDLFLKNGFRIERRHGRYYLGVLGACELVKNL